MISIRNYTKLNQGGGVNRIIDVKKVIDEEIITLEEAKAHCRIDFTDEDAYIESLIPVAREVIENYTGLSLIPTQITAIIQNEISGIMLPWGPYVENLILKDTDDVEIDTTDYTLKGQELFQYTHGEFTATYLAGYDEDTLPAALKMAILHQIAWLYEKRGDSAISPVAKQLAGPYKTQSWII